MIYRLRKNIAVDMLFEKASNHISGTKIRIQHSANIKMISTYWLIVRDIIEAERHGEKGQLWQIFNTKSF